MKVECGSKGGRAACNSDNCHFTYLDSQTPFIQEIVPRSSISDTLLYIYGKHRISDPGDGRSDGAGQIQHLLVG